MFHFLRDYQH